MELLIMLLVPLLAVTALWGTPLWGCRQDAGVRGAGKGISRHAVLRTGCLLAAFLGWYAGGVATKLAAAAQQQHHQKQQQSAAVGGGDQPGMPHGVEILEVLSPANDTRPKVLARLANGLEVLAMQDGTALEGGGVHVAASLGAGFLKDPLHLPGLSFLVAHCTFRGERLTAHLPFASVANAHPQQHDKQQQQQKNDQEQPQQKQQHERRFDSFAALIWSLGAAEHMHLSVTESETSVAFQVPLEHLALAFKGFRDALTAPSLCSNDLDGALAELKQLQTSLQQQCAADYHCRRAAILKNHVLNPNHRMNRFHRVGLELLHALRTAQWKSRDLGGCRESQKQERRLQLENQWQQGSLGGIMTARSLQLTREEQQTDHQNKHRSALGESGVPHKLGGFQKPRLVYVEELGADVLTPDVDIGASAALWREYFYVPNAMKLVVVGPAAPQALLRVVHQTFGSLRPNPLLRPFDCRDTRASEIEALNPPAARFATHWHPHEEAHKSSDSSKRNNRPLGPPNRIGAPPACPNPKHFTEADNGMPLATSPEGLGAPEPVARLNDLSKLVLMLPASRQLHTLEFAFVFENEGNRRPPCRHPRLAAALLGLEGPGSGIAALRSSGLADSVKASVAFTACSMELRVTLAVPGGALKHSVIELAGKLFFTSLQLWKHLPAAPESWGTVLRRFQAEEMAFNIHNRHFPSKTPSLSGLSTAAAYGEGATGPFTLAPLPQESLVSQIALPQMSSLQEAISLANGLQNGMGASVFAEEWLLDKVSRDEFASFLSTLTPSRLIVILSTPLVTPLCTRSASFLRLPFSVMPLEEQWEASWSAIAALSAEETFGLVKRLGLAFPLGDPFLPLHNWQQKTVSEPVENEQASGPASAAPGAMFSAEHPVEPITFSTQDICSDLCEAFIDRRNPQQIPKAYATFLVFPLLPTELASSSSGNSKKGTRTRRRQYERIKSLVALSLFIHTVLEMLSDVG